MSRQGNGSFWKPKVYIFVSDDDLKGSSVDLKSKFYKNTKNNKQMDSDNGELLLLTKSQRDNRKNTKHFLYLANPIPT